MSIENLTTLTFDIGASGIAVLTINRPEKLNALSAEVLEDLETCLNHVQATDAVCGLIITGAGPKSFVAGADIQQFSTLTPETARRFALKGQTVFSHIEQVGKPVLAAVNGYALGGGCELALACHLRIASENATFGQPEVNLGLIPGYGGTQRLPRIIGRGAALEMILTGKPITAHRAYGLGLVSQVVPAVELLDTAHDLMQTILDKAPIAVQLAIEAVYAADAPLQQGLEHEALLFGQVFGTDDVKEGVAAFLERRKPHFKGR